MPLRTKLTLAFVCCALVPLLPSAAVIYAKTTGGLARIQGQVLATAATTARGDLAERQIEQVASLTSSGKLQQLVSGGDTAATTGVLSGLVDNHGFVEAQIFSGRGGERPFAQVAAFESPVVLSYLRPDALGQPTFDFQNYLGEVWLVTAHQIPLSSGKPATLVCAKQLDDATLGATAQRTGSQLSLYTGPVPAVSGNQASRIGFELVASSLPINQRKDALLFASGSHRTTAGWTTAATTLDDGSGRPIAVAEIGVPDVAYASIRSSMDGALLLALILALAAAVVATGLISQVIMRPVLDLCRAAKAIAAGELAQRLDVRGNDEVAEASRAFNDMSRHVALTMEGLSEQIQSLSRELADLSLVGETLSQSADVKAALMPVAARVREMTDSDFCGLHLLEGELMAPGLYSGYITGSVQPIEELACRVVSHGEVRSRGDLARDARLLSARETDFASLVAVPIAHQGRVMGAVTVGSRVTKNLRPRHRRHPLHRGKPGGHRTGQRRDLQGTRAQLPANRDGPGFSPRGQRPLHGRTCGVACRDGVCRRGRSWAWQIRSAAAPIRCGSTRRRQDRDPLTVLDKPGPLTDAEFRLMREHTVIGERIVSRIDYLRPLAGVIRSAHERWDGRGYPDGLAGESIPLESRIIFACDAYHAMTSDRCYRKAVTPAAARAELEANSGSQFDPTVIEAFLGVWSEPGATQVADSGLAVSSTVATTILP